MCPARGVLWIPGVPGPVAAPALAMGHRARGHTKAGLSGARQGWMDLAPSPGTVA